MSMIAVNRLTFAYPGSYDNIFENVSFTLDTDWRLGFIGRNGRGKTTFLRLLMGEFPYRGSITASVDFTYFPYPVPDMEEMTFDVLRGAAPDAPDWALERELGKLQVDADVLWRPFSTLSPGERTKALLAALFLRENRFLLIDEPTNHLDMEGRAAVARYLRGQKGYILVSHDRAFLDACVDHILSLNRADIQVTRGNFSTWKENKDRTDHDELEENDRLQKDIRRMEQARRRTADWSDRVESSKIGGHVFDRGAVGAKAAKMMQRSKAIQARQDRAIEEKSRLLHNIERSAPLKLSPVPYRSRVYLRAQNLQLFYGDMPVGPAYSFTVEAGDRIALRGKNGAGKSTLLRAIAGQDISHTGTLTVGSGLVVSHIPQDASFLSGPLMGWARTQGVDESLFLAILRKLDFSREQFEKDMDSFSAGQKKKVLIARSLCMKAHLYLWDEPLNYIDLISRMQIEELLREYPPTMVFVEHDRAFSDAVATRVLEL